MSGITFLLALVATGLFLYAYTRGGNLHWKGVRTGGRMLVGMFPLLLAAFVLAGFLEVLIPPELVRTWLGDDAGWRAILMGSFAGALIPGGPYVSFPIMASVFRAGASLGTAVSFITGWALWNTGILSFELALMGPRFTLVRVVVTSIFPPLAGFLAQLLVGGGF